MQNVADVDCFIKWQQLHGNNNKFDYHVILTCVFVSALPMSDSKLKRCKLECKCDIFTALENEYAILFLNFNFVRSRFVSLSLFLCLWRRTNQRLIVENPIASTSSATNEDFASIKSHIHFSKMFHSPSMVIEMPMSYFRHGKKYVCKPISSVAHFRSLECCLLCDVRRCCPFIELSNGQKTFAIRSFRLKSNWK